MVKWRWKIHALRKDKKWLSVVMKFGLFSLGKKKETIYQTSFFGEEAIFQNHYLNWELVKLKLPLSFSSVWNLGQKRMKSESHYSLGWSQDGRCYSHLYLQQTAWIMAGSEPLRTFCIFQLSQPLSSLNRQKCCRAMLQDLSVMTFCRHKKWCWNTILF